MACIHYKFKNSLDFDSITFDGLHISVRDLKMSIMQRKKLNDTDMDLLIINALNAKAYKDEEEMIPKNASVIVARIPLSDAPRSKGPKTLNLYKDEKLLPQVQMPDPTINRDSLSEAADLVTAKGSEEDKIKAMMKQSTKDFDPANYQKKLPTGTPSPSYVCFKCNRTGHFIHNCPNAAVTSDAGSSNSPKPAETTENLRMKRPTGIPHTFLTVTSRSEPGAMSLGDGRFAVPTIDQQAFKKGKKERPPFLPAPVEEKKVDVSIPAELTCLLCKDLLTDAVVIPCCGNSYCDECIRNYLLEEEDHKCPTCHEENVSPDKLIINKSLRLSVNNFKNETLYQKQEKKKSQSPPPPPPPRTTSSTLTAPSLKIDTSIRTIDLTNETEPEPETPVLDEIKDEEVGKGIAVLSGRKAVISEGEKPSKTTTSNRPTDTTSTSSVDSFASSAPIATIPTLGTVYRPVIQPASFPNTALPPPGYGPMLYHGLVPPPFTVPPRFIPPQVSKPLSKHEFYREKERLLGKPNPLDDYTRPATEKEPIKKKSKSKSPKRRSKSPKSRSRSRTPKPVTRDKKSYSRSPPPKKRSYTKSRSRSPYRKKKSFSRSRSRSLTPRRRSRSPLPRSRSLTPRSRSRSWTPRKFRGRSRSFTRSRSRSRSRTPRLRRRSFSRTPPPRRRSYSRSLTPRRRSFSRSPPRRRSRSPFYRGRARSPGYYGRDWSPPPYRSGYRSPPPARGFSPTRYGPQPFGYGRDFPSRFDPRMYEELFQDYIARYGLPPPPPPAGQPDRGGVHFDAHKGVYKGGSRSRSRSPKSHRRGDRNRDRKEKDDKHSKSKDKDREKDKKVSDKSKSKSKREEEKSKEKNSKPKEKDKDIKSKKSDEKENKSKKPDVKTEAKSEKHVEKVTEKKTVKKVVKLKDGTIVKKETLALRLKTKASAGKSPVKGKDTIKKNVPSENGDKISAINRSGALKTIATVEDVPSVTNKEPLHSKRPNSNLIEINTQQILPEVKKSSEKNKDKNKSEAKKAGKEDVKKEEDVEMKDISKEETIKENGEKGDHNDDKIKNEEEIKKVIKKEPSAVASPKKVKVVKKVKKVKKLEGNASQSDSTSDLEKAKMRKKKRVQEVNEDNENSAEESPAKRMKQETDDEKEMDTNVNHVKDEDQLMLSPPRLSKWERDDYDEDKSPDLRDKLKKKAEKKPLSKSIIESAEKAITQKQPKLATVASAVVPARPQKKISVHDRLQKSPIRQTEEKVLKSPIRHNRKVYMDDQQNNKQKEEEENRKVRSKENSMRITVSSDKNKSERETENVPRRMSESEKSDKRRAAESEKSDKHDKRKVLPVDDKSDKSKKPKISRQNGPDKSERNVDIKDINSDKKATETEKSEGKKNEQEEIIKTESEPPRKKKYERKESIIDESAFVPDYNEHSNSEGGSDGEASSGSQEEADEKSDKEEKKSKKHKKEKKNKKNKKHKHKHKKKKHKKHKEEKEAAGKDE